MVDIQLPYHLSFSQSTNLTGEYCGGQYWFERGLGKPSLPGWAAIGGTALHSASEDWDHRLLQGEVETEPSAFTGMFGAAFDVEIRKVQDYSPYDKAEWQASGRTAAKVSMNGGPNKKDEAWWREMGPQMLASYAAWRLTSSWEIAQLPDPNLVPAGTAETAVEEMVWGIEIPFEVELGGVPVRGYIDRVFWNTIAGEQVYMVLDLKSGREPDSTAQLGTYRAGLVKQYGIDPKYGCYWLGGTGQSTSFTDLQAKWPLERVERRFATARRRQLAGEFDPKPSNLCGSCGVREFCAEYGGSKADATPQPWTVGTVTIAPPAHRV